MFPFLAPAALRLIAGRAVTNAAHDAAAVSRWLGTLNLYQIGCIVLGLLLAEQHIALVLAHRHSAKLQTQLTGTRAAFDTTVANYRVAATKAAADDKANADRVRGEQSRVNQERSNEFEARIAAARAIADRLRAQLAAAHPGGPAKPPVPGLPSAGAGSPQAAGQDGFSIADRLTATEQAIQLDELIKWVQQQHAVDPNK